MSTQAQAQHCKEYMQPIHINTRATSVLAKHIVEQIRKKLRASEEGGLGVNRQKICQERFHGMSYRSSSSIILRAGCSIMLLSLHNFHLLLIVLIAKQFAKEPSRTAFDSSRRPYFRPGTGFGRREHLFGVGWFLEWPGGQRPLNSTWPWSGVKLSILVLWGVCWMFYMRMQCWQQAQPHTSHSHSHPQTSLRKAPRPSVFHLSPTAKNYLSSDQQQTGSVIKQEQEPYDPFILGQYQDNHSNHTQGDHLQRPSDSNWPLLFEFDPHLNNTRICKQITENQGIFQPIPKSDQIWYPTRQYAYTEAAAPRTQQVLVAMSNTPERQNRQPKSPVLPQGSYNKEGITDSDNITSHNLNPDHDTNGLVPTLPAVPEVSKLQTDITTVGLPILIAEGRESENHSKETNGGGNEKNGLLSVAGTSPHHFSAQGKHQFAASQAPGYQALHYQESNRQSENHQAGLRDNTYFPEDYDHDPDSNFFQYQDNSRPNNNMSLSYESRSFMTDTQYPMQMAHETQEQDEFKPHDEHNYPSPPPPMSENPYTTQSMTETPDHPSLELPELPKDEDEAPSPGRSKPVPKPDREITKDANGRFYCTWPGCTEEVKDFNRKCEWSKHMDKHDRPYRCKEPGCEKLPGFTYSGGLLRHEREVHGKHGGPKKQLNCPHPNCKRHTGKGFSRQENLNEHLRRVHTADTGMIQMSQMNMDETEEDASQAIITGMKRKRGNSKGDVSELESLREEIKKMKAENDELKRQSQAQQAQTAEVMRQLVELQNLATLQHPRMNAPQATM
ncbi:uncharacterized protein EAE97_004227 [Botrytis byssoidea]|uniref:C2H2-type domain-containing protein n=1 Tax=Botrytis byssoidea TaxID=139641 RepID=A0A9P5ITL6_9HELO|nr:uncharacterized protein EAE97_004227 [Botrytis byssoidea]KAF7946978.1 hypothetical protein EAE97_004227 [Botrytis byssoidea]